MKRVALQGSINNFVLYQTGLSVFGMALLFPYSDDIMDAIRLILYHILN